MARSNASTSPRTSTGHILKTSRVPPPFCLRSRPSGSYAAAIAEAFGYVGVLAVEMFVVKDGAGHSVLVNEIARGCTIRPLDHRWRIGFAIQQHIRAVAGLPLGMPIRRTDRDDQPDRADVADVPRWLATLARRAPLWQDRVGGPQDGACDAGVPNLKTTARDFAGFGYRYRAWVGVS